VTSWLELRKSSDFSIPYDQKYFLKVQILILSPVQSKPLTDFASCERGENATKTEKTQDD
jgi:hypothetical protein